VSVYESYALRYAHRQGDKAEEFYCFRAYQEQDEPWGVDYYFWMLRNDDRTVLVDCGFDEESARLVGRHVDTDPVLLLDRLGVTPESIDHVVITHMHYDHIGNVDLFPRATFSVAREEYDFWTGPRSQRDLFAWAGQPGPIAKVERLAKENRVRFIDGPEEVVPGVRLRPVGGHTPGTAIVEVESTAGHLTLASDAAHFYEEYERDRPYILFNDLEAVYGAYDVLRENAQRPDGVVVPGHDPRIRREFVEVAPDCWDLSRPVAGQVELTVPR
jgi:glyoxylase-like metal-dependent hydrolase (beta-lactamase superfamily II)